MESYEVEINGKVYQGMTYVAIFYSTIQFLCFDWFVCGGLILFLLNADLS